MSKGAIRVAVCLETSKTIEDHKERIDDYYSCNATYIFKKDILTVERFDSCHAMHAYFHQNGGGYDLPLLGKHLRYSCCLQVVYRRI